MAQLVGNGFSTGFLMLRRKAPDSKSRDQWRGLHDGAKERRDCAYSWHCSSDQRASDFAGPFIALREVIAWDSENEFNPA